MEKVKLTREQANAIEHALQEVDEYKGNPDRLLRHASMNNVNFRNELHLLDTIDIVTLAKALYIGYEVEPEYKVGDWVVNANGTIGKITNINEFGEFEGFWEEIEMLCEKDNFVRHATPEEIEKGKERRWWAKLGRQPYEFKMGDIVTWEVKKGLFEVVSHKGEMYKLTRDFCDSEFLALTKNLKLVCPVENRLDVKTNA